MGRTGAREIRGAQQDCALTTIDEASLPPTRTMNPFPPDEGMVVWMATNRNTWTSCFKVVPERVDALNYKRGVIADHGTWRTASIAMPEK